MINSRPVFKVSWMGFLVFLNILLIIAGCQNPENNTSFPIDLTKARDSLTFFAPSFISTGLYERDLAISRDGNEIIFSRGDHKQTRRVLMSSVRTTSGWSDPVVLSFSGEHQDIEPFFSPSDDRIYFASDRPFSASHKKKNYNIWYSEKKGDHWGDPIALDTLINTEGDEYYPSLSANGNLYFTASRKEGIGREDIFYSPLQDGEYQQIICLDTLVNTPVYEFNAYVSPDEELLIFSSYGRKDGIGGGDLYYSTKDSSGNWTPSKNLGDEINSSNLDYCPFYLPDSETLFLTSDRTLPLSDSWTITKDIQEFADSPGNGYGDIYWIKWKPK